MRRLTLLVFLILATAAAGEARAEESFHPQGNMLRKLERGGANALLGGLEFVYHLRQPDEGQWVPPWFTGMAKGFYHTLERSLVGIYEILTFPIPIPEDYLPVLEPEFSWEYFNRKNQGEKNG